MDFLCPKCDSEMTLSENTHVCAECDHKISIDEATQLFEDGKLVGIVAEDELTEEQKEKLVISSIDEDIAALVEGEELSEAFVEKAKVIFESAVAARVEEETAAIKQQAEEYRALIEEETMNEMVEKIDGYLDHVVSQWVEENKLAIESGIKAEMNEAFAEGIAELLKSHYIKAPEDRWDIVEGLADKVEELEAKLDESIEREIEAKKKIFEAEKVVKFAELSEGLTDTQKEKLEKLSEKLEADNIEEYTSKVETLVESYFSSKKKEEVVVEEKDESENSNQFFDLSEAVRLLSKRD